MKELWEENLSCIFTAKFRIHKRTVLWTDEVKTENFGCGDRYVWRAKGAEFIEENTCLRMGHGSSMLWGCSQWQKDGLNEIPTNSGSKYHHLSNIGRMVVSQIMNDPKHTSKSTIVNLKKHRPEVLLWPSQWIDLKRGPGISQNWKTFLRRMPTVSAHIKTLKRQPSGNNSSTIFMNMK